MTIVGKVSENVKMPSRATRKDVYCTLKEYLSEVPVHVTVMCLVTEPLSSKLARIDKPHGFSYVNTN